MDEEPIRRKKVWLDCDPGHDDVFAIILAALGPNIELLGISTVAANQSVDKTTLNACKVVTALNLDVPVYRGQASALLRPVTAAVDIHGVSGLDGSDWLENIVPRRDVLQSEKAVNAMYQTIIEQKEKVWIIATGSLTNVALAVTLYPEMIKNLHGISIMGGAMGIGNITPGAEFNIWTDPESAQMVFNLGKAPLNLPVILVPLDVTHTCIVTATVMEMVWKKCIRSNTASPITRMCMELLQYFALTNKEKFGFEDGPPLHDPCAVAYVLNPRLFEVQYMNVEVECNKSELGQGQTVCDIYGTTGREQNVHVCKTMDVEGFWDMMLKAIAAASSHGLSHDDRALLEERRESSLLEEEISLLSERFGAHRKSD